MTSGKCSAFCYFFFKRNLKNKKETILFQSSFIKRSPTKNVKLYGKIQGVTGNFSSHMRTRVRTHVKCLQLYHREFQQPHVRVCVHAHGQHAHNYTLGNFSIHMDDVCVHVCAHDTYTIIPSGILVDTRKTHTHNYTLGNFSRHMDDVCAHVRAHDTYTIIPQGILVDTRKTDTHTHNYTLGILVDTWTMCVHMFACMIHTHNYTSSSQTHMRACIHTQLCLGEFQQTEMHAQLTHAHMHRHIDILRII